MADWDVIKAEYIRGGTSYKKLSAKYSVSFSALRRKAEKEKWTELRAQSEHEASTKIVKSTAVSKARKSAKLEDVADMLMKRVTELISDSDTPLKPADIKLLSGTLRDLKDIKGIKTDRDIREQEARIAKLEKEVSEDAAAPVITVQLSDGLREWSE